MATKKKKAKKHIAVKAITKRSVKLKRLPVYLSFQDNEKPVGSVLVAQAQLDRFKKMNTRLIAAPYPKPSSDSVAVDASGLKQFDDHFTNPPEAHACPDR